MAAGLANADGMNYLQVRGLHLWQLGAVRLRARFNLCILRASRVSGPLSKNLGHGMLRSDELDNALRGYSLNHSAPHPRVWPHPPAVVDPLEEHAGIYFQSVSSSRHCYREPDGVPGQKSAMLILLQLIQPRLETALVTTCAVHSPRFLGDSTVHRLSLTKRLSLSL
jgi:hypothetical protein